MSLLKANSVQIGQSATATQNFTLSVPSSPDGTIKLARGNSGETTQDILTVNSSGAVTLTNGGTITSAAAQASTSGTAIDFTGIPSWAKKITVMFDGVSTNGSSTQLVQIGSSTFSTSGYASYFAIEPNGSSPSTSVSTAGFGMWNGDALELRYGTMTLTNITGNTWVSSHCGASVNSTVYYGLNGGGSVALSGALDRVRITTAGGTNTFDAGSVNIMYEG
jgi:hypothetical protein